MYVEVAVNLPPVRGTFDYHLPPEMRRVVGPGHLVLVPFGNRTLQGVVVRNLTKPSVPETKPVLDLADEDPVLTPQQLELARWIQSQTLAPLIDCLTLMLPPGLARQADSLYTLVQPDHPTDHKIESRVLSLLQKRGPLYGAQLQRSLSRFPWRSAIDRLVSNGVVERKAVLKPARARPRHVRTARLAMPPEAALAFEDLGRAGGQAAQRRRQVIKKLVDERGALEVTWLYAECDANSSDLRFLEERGLVALGEAEIWRDPLEDLDYGTSEPPRLTPAQAEAWEPIKAKLEGGSGAAFLLHGVTGSGKTEIYMQAVDHCLAAGKRALVLVPEIALTPQTVRRFLARFPGRMGLIHSQLSEGERYDTWRRARQGELDLVVGPRSALFTPLPNLGLIVLDESHDDSYKESERAPRYHARSAALAYADILPAVCVLGSATPDITTMYQAQTGQIEHLSLPQRIMGHRDRIRAQSDRLGVASRYQDEGDQAQFIDLPPVQVVDMRQELKAGNRSMFSRALQKALRATFDAGQQAILFLNRRGESTYVFCRDCGWVARCSQCQAPLTYHGRRDLLQCHRCGYKRKGIHTCPACGRGRVKHFGAGTQRVQKELEAAFPRVQTLRWDRDTTRGKGAHDVILANFAARKSDVLIGTQMVAKGLDLPLVTLVGVVSADVGLNLPDFRAAERTFQVLTQVSGRAGRGLLGGQVILQTYQPEHYVIQSAAGHDYDRFFQQELEHRRELGYPPFRRLTSLVYRHHDLTQARLEAERLAGQLRQRLEAENAPTDLIGPAPCFFDRVRGLYRWQIVLRAHDPSQWIPETLPEGWTIDVDPVSLL
ncbi:MAG: primosomal protein N' [Anaerolineales bacterium]|jgi:primosomal protein N' (replication factor Y)